jgi:4-hydroxy-3-methylbut-2-enyl diphosphate reductase
MKVIRAKTAGFCMGVSLALHTLDKAIAEAEKDMRQGRSARITTFGEIIHNPQVLAEYEAKGVRRAKSTDDITALDTVIIRAHGIPRYEEKRIRETGAGVKDATCPKVKGAQLAIAEATAQGQSLLLFGEADHPEVIGLISYAAGPCLLFDNMESFDAINLDKNARYVLAAQTTQDRKTFDLIAEKIHGIAPATPVLDTICDATSNRQQETLDIAAQVEAMVVVGGRNSGNTRRLATLTQNMGVETWHVETPQELNLKFLQKKCIIGLTAGASTPKRLIDETQFFLENIKDST